MKENTETVDLGAGKGALWTIAGTAIGGLATQLIGGRGLGLGLFGGNVGNAVTDAAGMAMALELAKKDSEIALLKADQDTDKKLVEVYSELRKQDKAQDANIAALNEKIHCLDKRIGEVALISSNGITMLNGAVAQLQHTVGSITRTVVPNGAICPGWGTVTVTPTGSGTIPGPTPA